MKIFSILQTLILCGIGQAVWAETCLPFMPEQATVQGTLSQQTFPGAPNYKSIEDGDKPEIHYFLELSPEICLAPSENDKMNKPTSSISKIQLRFFGEAAAAIQEKLKPYMGSQVKCTGGFFYGHAKHHHSHVLIRTQACEPVAAEIL